MEIGRTMEIWANPNRLQESISRLLWLSALPSINAFDARISRMRPPPLNWDGGSTLPNTDRSLTRGTNAAWAARHNWVDASGHYVKPCCD